MDHVNRKVYLVTGSESSGTKLVARWLAKGLGLIRSMNDWDGSNNVKDGASVVIHRSLPHGGRPNEEWITRGFLDKEGVDTIIICTRDKGSIIKSARKNHNRGDLGKTFENLARAKRFMGYLLNDMRNYGNVHVFSYESAILLGQKYFDYFGGMIKIRTDVDIELIDGNRKYHKEIKQ